MEIPDVLTDQDVGLPFMPILYMEIADVIDIKPISGNAHTDQDVGLPFMPIYGDP